MRSVMLSPTKGSRGLPREPDVEDQTAGEPSGVRGRCDALRTCCGDTTRGAGAEHPEAALDWNGMARSAHGAKRNKPLRCRPLEGRRDQKSPFVVALSCVPRGERGSPVLPPAAGCCRGPVSPPGCRPKGSTLSTIDPLRPLAAVRPLVRMPTNRHAATGTCEIGQGDTYGSTPSPATPPTRFSARIRRGGARATPGPRRPFSSAAGRAIQRLAAGGPPAASGGAPGAGGRVAPPPRHWPRVQDAGRTRKTP